MIDIYQSYTPNELRHALGAVSTDDLGSIVSALMIAVTMIGELQAKVNDLENLTANLRRYDESDVISAHETRYHR